MTQRLKVDLEQESHVLSPEIRSTLTGGTVAMVRGMAFLSHDGDRDVGAASLLSSIRELVGRGIKPDARFPQLIAGDGVSETLFLVRDGHSYRVDLTLSGITFAPLRDVVYP